MKLRAGAADGAALLTVLVVFALTRGYAAARGVRFDAGGLDWYWQFLDPVLLRTRLLESVFYLHSQPPLFNLGLGVLLKLTSHPEVLGGVLFTLLGLLLHGCLFALARTLGISRGGSAAAAILLACMPATVLYEHLLFYTYPAALLLVTAALCFARAQATRRCVWTAGCLASLCALSGTLSFFHWALVPLGGGILSAQLRSRRTAATTLLFTTLALLPTVRNALVFHVPAASTQLGMNLAKLALPAVPLEARQTLLREGAVSPLVMIQPFSPVSAYPSSLRGEIAFPRVPALTDELKSTGYPNLNHAAYVALGQAYARDSWTLIRRYPGSYLFMVKRAWLLFLVPATEYFGVLGNRMRISGWVDAYNIAVEGMGDTDFPIVRDAGQLRTPQLLRGVGWRWSLLSLLAWLWGLATALWDLSSRARRRAAGLTRGFLVFMTFYVAVLGTFFEVGENNRFHFMVVPLIIALGAALLSDLTRAWRSARSGPGATARSSQPDEGPQSAG